MDDAGSIDHVVENNKPERALLARHPVYSVYVLGVILNLNPKPKPVYSVYVAQQGVAVGGHVGVVPAAAA